MMTATARAHRHGPRPSPKPDAVLALLPEIAPQTRRRAATTVCAMSADAAEARDLLDALGLLADPAVTGTRRPVAS